MLAQPACRAQAFDPTSPSVLNAYSAPLDNAKVEAGRAGVNLLLPRVAGFPGLLTSGNTFFSGGFVLVSGSFHFGGGFAIVGSGPDQFTQTFDAASDADLATLGNPIILDNALLRATASFLTGRNIVVGPHPAGIDTQQFDVTLSGHLTANATLGKFGTGTLTLAGSASWAAAPFVSAGTLRASTAALQTDVDNNGTLEFSQNADGTYAHRISGTGILRKSGTAKVTLTAENYYGGATLIDQGTLALHGAGTLGTGPLAIGSGATFDLSGVGGDRTIGALSGTGSIVLGAHRLATTVGLGTTSSFGGSISGAGALGKDGPGTLELTGTNAYTGGTLLSAGTLALVGAGTLASAGRVTISGSARFDIAAAGGARTIGSLDGAGAVVLGTNDLTVGTDASDSGFSGTVHGTGTLTKTGTGTLELSGATQHAGRTVIAQGTVVARAASISGEIVNHARLVFLEERSNLPSPRPAPGTLYESYPELIVYSGNIAGTGSVVKRGSGALWLRGTNTYSGSTVVEDGILVGNDASLQGSIANHAGIAFYMTSDGNYAGTMSGSGLLLKYGPGNLVLSGQNTYTGGTGFSGRLTIGDDRNLGAPDGSVIIAGGTLRITSDIVSRRRFGLSAEGAALDTQSHDMNLTGIVSGTGSLTKLGPGRLTLAAANTYTGSTFVQAGTLQVDGSLAGGATVGTGARIAGTGSIQGVVTFAPGSGISVRVDESGVIVPLRAGSAVIQEARVFVDAAVGTPIRSHGALLSVTDSITGVFTDVSTNAAFLTPSLTYDARNVYLTLLRNDVPFRTQANTGTQLGIATSLDRLVRTSNPDAAVVASFIEPLTGDAARSAFDSIAGTGRVAFDAVQRTNTRSVIQQAFARLGLTENQGEFAPPPNLERIKLAFDSTATSDAAPDYAQGAASTLQDIDANRDHGLWMRSYGGKGRVDANATSSGAAFSVSGLLAGYDLRVGDATRAGLLFAYSKPKLDQAAPRSNSQSKIHQLALYGRHRVGALRIDAIAGYATSDIRATRNVVAGALVRQASADYAGNARTLSIEIAESVRIGSDTTLEPTAAINWSRQRYDAYIESGAGALNLSQSARRWESLQSSLGGRLIRTWQRANATYQVEARAAWLHEFHGATGFEVRLAADLASAPVALPTLSMPRNSAAVGLGISGTIDGKWSMYVDLNTERNSRQHVNTASAGVRFRW